MPVAVLRKPFTHPLTLQEHRDTHGADRAAALRLRVGEHGEVVGKGNADLNVRTMMWGVSLLAANRAGTPGDVCNV